MTAHGKHNNNNQVGFAGIARRSLLELLLFNIIITVVMGAVMFVISQATRRLLYSKGIAFTTSTIADVFLSWQGLLIIGLSLLASTLYIVIELFAHIYFCKGLLEGEEGSVFTRINHALKDALKTLPRFLSPGGVQILIYIVLLAPIVGVGFSVGLTRDFYIPSFIMSVIIGTPVYAVAYVVVIGFLAILAMMYFFTLHAMVLDGLDPAAARKVSRRIVRDHFFTLVGHALRVLLVVVAVMVVLYFLFVVVFAVLTAVGADLPAGYHVDAQAVVADPGSIDNTTGAVIAYRVACLFGAVGSFGLTNLITLLLSSCIMLYVTHLYQWLKLKPAKAELKPAPTYPIVKRKGHGVLILFLLLTILSAVVTSLLVGITYSDYIESRKHVNVVAHRLGGHSAPENSLEGLQAAIDQGCYAAETDIQRTKDGYYIINHDNTFARLSQNDAKPQDLTLSEIEQLRIRDPLFPDSEVAVPTFEEILDAAKDRIVLFVEFKGATADKQMVDDAVRIVREHDAVDDVVFISLNYDCISYGKTTYPEFEYGLLFFAEYGDIALLECDLLLAEEETASNNFIADVHEGNRKIGVWTANNESVLRRVLNGDADCVITDELELTASVQKILDNRTEVEIIYDLVWW